MLGESELTLLVSNIVSENRYSHCRLCLKVIQNNYVYFNDMVKMSEENTDYVCLGTLLTKFLGPEICTEILGVDALCMECVEQLLGINQFFKNCDVANKLLHKVFDNLITKVGGNIDTSKDHSLYITVGENETILAYKKNPTKKYLKYKEYSCPECILHFANIDELAAHNTAKHAKPTCKKCFEACANEDELLLHSEHSSPFKCNICNVHKCTSESLRLHNDKFHDRYVCKHCDKSFHGKEKLVKHEAKHLVRNECPKCGKIYNTYEFFLRHVKLCTENRLDIHPYRAKAVKNYVCTKCSKGYVTSGGLRLHNRFVHGNAKAHECPVCDKKFTAPSHLKVHMVTHTRERNFPCDQCGKKFVSKEALIYHIRRHTGEKPFSCLHCEERFVNASARAEHIKFKHAEPTLVCEVCSEKFVTRNILRQHMKKYHFDQLDITKERQKRHSCIYCEEQFVNASARAEHIKTAHAEPTHACEICPEKFLTRNILRQHVNKYHFEPLNIRKDSPYEVLVPVDQPIVHEVILPEKRQVRILKNRL